MKLDKNDRGIDGLGNLRTDTGYRIPDQGLNIEHRTSNIE